MIGALAYVLPLLVGAGLTRLLLKSECNGWFLLFVSPAVGFGVLTFTQFLCFYFSGQVLFWPCLFMQAALVFIFAGFYGPRKLSFPFVSVFIVVLTVGFLLMTVKWMQSPYGAGLDVWAIWKLKARFLYYDHDAWRHLFLPALDFSCRDYPLLYPLSLVWGWQAAGSETLAAAFAISAIFTLSSVGLLMALVCDEGRWWSVLLAGFFLVATPQFIGMGASQYADILVSYYFLAGVVSIRRSNLLAGFVIGCAAFVKNEGLLFAACIFLMLAVFREFKTLRRVFAGALPMLIIVSLFKTRVGVSNDSVALHNFSELVQRGDILQKLSVIARFLKEQFFHENLWVYAWFYIMLTCIFFCKRIPTQTRLACLLVLLAAGYTTVYLLSPLELERNLATSIDRVLLHVFPLSVFFVFLLKEDGASGPKMLSFLK